MDQGSQTRPGIDSPDDRRTARREPLATRRTRGTISLPEGRDVSTIELLGPRPGPTVAFVAGVHGDEVECIAVLEDWLADAELEAGKVLAVPVANPDALALGTRRGPDDVDLNRVAPGDISSDRATVRLAAALHETLLGADAVLTMHSWSRGGETVPYVEFPRDSGPATSSAARELALALGLPWAEPWDWPQGLLPAALVREGIPSVEIEIGGLGRTTSAGHATGLRLLGYALEHLGLRGRGTSPPPTEIVERHWLAAPIAGRVRQLVPLGSEVGAGEALVELRDEGGQVGAVIAAPAAGVMAIHVTYGEVASGDPVAVLFTPTEPS